MSKTYIGDSVYADFERGMLKLTTENGFGPSNTIFLEPFVWNDLKAYVQRYFEANAVPGKNWTGDKKCSGEDEGPEEYDAGGDR